MTVSRGWQDVLRHLEDLKHGTYEGAAGRAAKEEVFHHAVTLLAPVVD